MRKFRAVVGLSKGAGRGIELCRRGSENPNDWSRLRSRVATLRLSRHGELTAATSYRRGGFHVDHELESGRLFDRQVGRLCTLENLVGENRGAPVEVDQ